MEIMWIFFRCSHTLRLNKIYVEQTGRKLTEIEKVMDRDTFMSAEEARDFGLIDHVVKNRDDLAEIVKKQEDEKKDQDNK